MASESRFFQHGVLLNDNRTPFHVLLATADATGGDAEGVEVVAADATGKTHYLMGMVLHNTTVGAIKIMPVTDASEATVAQIGAYVTVAAGGSVVIDYPVPLAAGAGLNLGANADGAGAVQIEFLGYTV